MKTTNGVTQLNEDNKWSHTFTELAKYENGQEIEYSVEEVNVPDGYSVSVTENSADEGGTDQSTTHSFTIINAYTPELTNVSVNKVWEDNNNVHQR